jgi:hypothetical protein
MAGRQQVLLLPRPVSQNGYMLSRRGRRLPANASGLDTHRDSISSLFDCSWDNLAPPDENGMRTSEVYRVQLPGHMLVGEGKPENQNHAMIFTRGTPPLASSVAVRVCDHLGAATRWLTTAARPGSTDNRPAQLTITPPRPGTGEYLQTLDMNQDGYFEEALKLRNLLEEFGDPFKVRFPLLCCGGGGGGASVLFVLLGSAHATAIRSRG